MFLAVDESNDGLIQREEIIRSHKYAEAQKHFIAGDKQVTDTEDESEEIDNSDTYAFLDSLESCLDRQSELLEDYEESLTFSTFDKDDTKLFFEKNRLYGCWY